MNNESSPWEELARKARALAGFVEAVADRQPHRRSRDVDAWGTDHLRGLELKVQELQTLVAQCRRATYQELREDGWLVADIAGMWQISSKAVYKSLSASKRKTRNDLHA